MLELNIYMAVLKFKLRKLRTGLFNFRGIQLSKGEILTPRNHLSSLRLSFNQFLGD